MNVLAIGYSKHLFKRDDAERARLLACAKTAGVLHMVIFTHVSECFSNETIDGVLHLHPTQSRLGFMKFFNAIGIAWRIVRSERTAPWVITAQDPFEAGLVASFLSSIFRIPYNLQEHGDFFSTSHWRRESFRNRVRAAIGKTLLKEAQSVRVVSKRVHATMRSLGVPSNRLHQLPVTVDTARFSTASPSPTLIPGYAPQKRYILTVGRFVKQKNLPLLIRAFARVRSYHTEAELIIVGKGQEASHIQSVIREVGGERITILPWSDDVPALMATAHLYALSSNYEGWGRVLVEARAAGLPIVTTEVGCVGEAIFSDADTHVVPVGNEAKFAAALTAALKRVPHRVPVSAADGPALDYQSYARAWTQILEETRQKQV